MAHELFLYIASVFRSFSPAFFALAILLFFSVVISVIRWLAYFTGLADYLRRFK